MVMKGFYTFLFLMLISIGTQGQGYKIEFKIKGLEDSKAILGYYYGDKKYMFDSLRFDGNGSATVSGDSEIPKGVYFIFKEGYYLEFIISEQRFKMTTSSTGGYEQLKLVDSPENERFKKFQLRMGGFQRAQKVLGDSLKTAESSDSVLIVSKLKALDSLMIQFQDSLIASQPESFLSGFVRMMRGVQVPLFKEIENAAKRDQIRSNYYKAHYFDMMETPQALMRTPLFHQYAKVYFEQVVPPLPDTVTIEIDRWLELCRPDKQTFNFWLAYFLKEYQDAPIMGMDAVWIHMIEKYCLTGQAEWMDEKLLKQLSDEVRFIKPNLIGKPAPRFYAIDTLMRPVDYSRLQKNYLVLFFYDPDCGHCKKKVPILNAQHDEIKALGGEIVGVCTTTEVEKWKKFIREHKLTWVHLADPFGKSDFRVNYNTRTTPQLYVLDKDKVIIAKKLDVDKQLVDFLKRHIESK